MIKKFIKVIVVMVVLNSVASMCAMLQEPALYKLEDSDDEELQVDDSDVPGAPMTEKEMATVNRIAAFCVKRAADIFPLLSPLLPVDGVVDMVLDYAKPTRRDVAQANRNLIKAVRYNSEKEVVIALNEGANPSKVVEKLTMRRMLGREVSGGEPLLARAVERGNVTIIKALVEHKGDVNAANRSRHTILHTALRSRMSALLAHQADIVALLLNHQACVNARDELSATPLMYAIRIGLPEIVKMFMQVGADPEIVDWEQKNAWAEAEGKPGMLKIMREALHERAQAAAILLKEDAMVDDVEVAKESVPERDSAEMMDDHAALGATAKKEKRRRTDQWGFF